MLLRATLFLALAVAAVAVFLTTPTMAFADDPALAPDGWSWNDEL